MERSHKVEEDDNDDAETKAKAGPSKTRQTFETVAVSATNLTSDHSRTGSLKESHYSRDKSGEDVNEECKHLSYYPHYICAHLKGL